MARLEIKRQMGSGDIASVSELLAVAAQADGHAPLGEHQWLDLVHGGRPGFAGLVAWEPGHSHPVGYAQLSRNQGPDQVGSGEPGASWALEYVVDPHHRCRDPDIGPMLVQAALEVIATEGGGHVHLWVPHPRDDHDRLAAQVGLRRGRELRQMRLDLPMAGHDDDRRVPVRAFKVGRDEPGWLVLNNRAFDWHPEQGGWDLATLHHRQEQPWFDPGGLLLHEMDGRLVGSCWTKVHGDHDPPLGELYVVAVDPDFQGQGLGRALVLAGLDHLAVQGLRRAVLYVDASNQPAIALYERLGFSVDHVDRAYVGDVAAVASA
ncbi:MAG: mycothiol synthase [Acidimicrobiales bacterium]